MISCFLFKLNRWFPKLGEFLCKENLTRKKGMVVQVSSCSKGELLSSILHTNKPLKYVILWMNFKWNHTKFLIWLNMSYLPLYTILKPCELPVFYRAPIRNKTWTEGLLQKEPTYDLNFTNNSPFFYILETSCQIFDRAVVGNKT